MSVDTLAFVSKRLSVAVAAILCLTAARLAHAAPGAFGAAGLEVRVAISK